MQPKTVYGVVSNGYFLGDDGMQYPIPGNYVSKSKLLPGDRLKLYLSEDGIVFKQVDLVPRKHVYAKAVKDEKGRFFALDDSGKTYGIHCAASTFFHLAYGDDIIIIVPADGRGDTCALEGVIKQLKKEESYEKAHYKRGNLVEGDKASL